jgi:hypothetical protein
MANDHNHLFVHHDGLAEAEFSDGRLHRIDGGGVVAGFASKGASVSTAMSVTIIGTSSWMAAAWRRNQNACGRAEIKMAQTR